MSFPVAGWLTAVTAAIVRDYTEAVLREKEHLAVPGVRISGHPCENVTTGPLPQSL